MSVYLIRKDIGNLASVQGVVSDTLFANQRFDGEELSGQRFEHCTFANVSFLRAKLKGCHFSNCIFEGCYFRRSEVVECNFPASRFIDCEFSKPNFYACGFQTTRFRRSVPVFHVIEPSLPGEPNLCRALCDNLANEAQSLGLDREARSYRLQAIRARQAELRAGYRWSDQYSQDHYPELERVTAFVELCASRLNGWVWGHGEYVSRLLLNVALLAFLIGPLLLYLGRDHLHSASSISVWDCLALSVASVVNTPSSSGLYATGIGLAIVLGLAALGLTLLGLFVTYLFRAVTRR
jgi:hypothetical protein